MAEPLSSPANRWLAETGGTRGPAYAERFRKLAAEGADMFGEARFVASLLPPPARILDAGCGMGRLGIELASHGYDIVGVDVDASMLAQARAVAPQLAWHVADLLDAPELPDAVGGFDVVVAAGNVMVYLTPGTEATVVGRLAEVLRPGGLLVAGFRPEQFFTATDYRASCAAVGLVETESWSSWDRADSDGDGYTVSVHRSPPNLAA